jgi:hypothetical protein
MIEIFKQLGDDVGKIIVEAVKKAFIMQGHKMTGALNESIEYKAAAQINSVSLEFLMLDYGMIQNFGVTPERIPFNSGSGNKTSKYIDGLKRFAKIKLGKNDKEAERIAFAIAYKQKQEGMPTKGSYKYSKTGKRTGAVLDALRDSEDEVTKLINLALEEYIFKNFVDVITTVNKKDSENIKFYIK